MAEKKFPLKKEIISNETAKKLNDGVFNEIALSEEKFDDTILMASSDVMSLITKFFNVNEEL